MKKNMFFLFMVATSSLSLHGMEMGFKDMDKDSIVGDMFKDADNSKKSSSWKIKNKRGKTVLVYLGRKSGTQTVPVAPSNKELDKEGYFGLEDQEKVTIELDQLGTGPFDFWAYEEDALVKLLKRTFDSVDALKNNIKAYPKYIIESDYALLSLLEDRVQGLTLDSDNDPKEVKGAKKRK